MGKRSWFGLVCGVVMGCSGDDPPGISPITPYSLEAPAIFGEFEIPQDNPLTEQGVELGRMLFYDRILSADNSMSCSSCHQQSKAFTDGQRFFTGFGGHQGNISTMSLANLLWTSRFMWDGRVSSVRTIVTETIENPVEFNSSVEDAVERIQNAPDYPLMFQAAFGTPVVTEENMGKAVEQFVYSLVSSDSKFDRFLRGEYEPTQQERQGIELFNTHPIQGGIRGADCIDCHNGFLTSGESLGFSGFRNNGLDGEEDLRAGLERTTGNRFDRGKFKVVTLRNIELTGPYMHDGRFATLEEVLDHYNEHIQTSETLDPLMFDGSNDPSSGNPLLLGLTDDEKQAIIAFLKMLTDETFVNDPDLSDPF